MTFVPVENVPPMLFGSPFKSKRTRTLWTAALPGPTKQGANLGAVVRRRGVRRDHARIGRHRSGIDRPDRGRDAARARLHEHGQGLRDAACRGDDIDRPGARRCRVRVGVVAVAVGRPGRRAEHAGDDRDGLVGHAGAVGVGQPEDRSGCWRCSARRSPSRSPSVSTPVTAKTALVLSEPLVAVTVMRRFDGSEPMETVADHLTVGGRRRRRLRERRAVVDRE